LSDPTFSGQSTGVPLSERAGAADGRGRRARRRTFRL